MCIRIYSFNFKKQQTNKQKKQELKKAKEINEENRKWILKKTAATRVKISLVTYISGNKSFFWSELKIYTKNIFRY